MRKKVVWLPYDMDTAIGINNEGALAFSYNLEDTDQISGGADVYNGQNSVMWVNLRQAFSAELKAMYQSLRSTGVLSYATIEQMFEEHQGKWPEAIFNEDALFKYLEPLFNDNDAAYLSMLQGSKAEQRKWWLYNRFKYLDSKYNAGDALTDVITLRGYALGNITVTPYADIYPTIKYGSYLVQTRGTRGQAYTLVNPLDAVNDTEIYIYSASQLASVGDISPLKVGYANFSFATKLQDIKIGDADQTYANGNLTELYLGNNTLLQTLDVRNCPNLAQTVDLKGCSNIEEVYFDGTGISGVELPNGGVLNTLHLPDTITNLTIRNQPLLTDLDINDFSNISTLWLENAGVADEASKQIVCDISDNARVRLLGIDWEMEDAAEFKTVFDKVNTYRGLDEQGGNMNVAQLTGAVHTPSASKAYFRNIQARYPYVTFTADELSSLVKQCLEGNLTSYEDSVITTISPNAFNEMTTLISFLAPNVVTIGDSAFSNCTNLTGSLIFENGVTAEGSAFNACSKLEKLYMGGNDSALGAYTVRHCTMLKEIRLPRAKPSFTFGGYGLDGNRSLELIDFGNANQATFNNLPSCPLHTLILRKTSICTLGSSTALDSSTAFKNGGTGGQIYIPESLYSHLGDGSSSDYKAASNWSVYNAYGTITWKKIEGSEYELSE